MASEGNQEVKKMVITLKSEDGKEFVVERKVAEESKVFKNLIEDVCTDDSPIPIPKVPSDALESLLKYCEKHSEEPPKGDKQELAKHQDALICWDYNYMKKVENNLELFIELIFAADYLEIQGLLDLISESEKFDQLRKMVKIKIAARDAEEFLKRRGIV